MNSYTKTCQICFENIFIKGKINSCDHSFHYNCIYRWSKISANCPTCRLSFSEISQEINGKLIKNISLDENFQFCDEGVNLDNEDWAVFCIKCNVSSAESTVTCKGALSCPVVIHTYCLDDDIDPNKWLCSDCFIDFSEFSMDEEGSFSESAERSSEIIEIDQSTSTSTPKVINLDDSEDVVCIESPNRFVVNEYLVEDKDGEFINHQLINFQIPRKRNREEGVQKFIVKEIEKEVVGRGLSWNRGGAVFQKLQKIIRRNLQKDLFDEDAQEKVRNFIRHYIAGLD